MSEQEITFRIGALIDEDTADRFIDNYWNMVPNTSMFKGNLPVRSIEFNDEDIKTVMGHGAKKIRAYLACNDVGVTLVLVGIDNDGNEIRIAPKQKKPINEFTRYKKTVNEKTMVEYGNQCPPLCDKLARPGFNLPPMIGLAGGA